MAQAFRVPGRKNRGNIAGFRILSPNKGLNNLVPDTDIDDLETPDALNMDFVERGNPSTRKGRVSFDTIDSDGIGDCLIPFYKSNGNKYLLKVSGTSLKSINIETGALTPISGKVFTADKISTGVVANDAVYILNGTDIMGKYDGSNLTTPVAGVPIAWGIWYKGFFFGGGNPAKPNTLYKSAVNTPDDFTAGNNTYEVDSNDGDKLMGIGLWSDALILFKERAIYQVTLDTTGSLTIKPIIKGIGCVSHRTVKNVDNDLFYLSRKGIYVVGNEPNFYTAIRTNELSARIRNTMDMITPEKFEKTHAIYTDFKYILCVPLGGTTSNSHAIIYDKKFLSFSLWDNQPFSAITNYIDAKNNEIILATSDINGKLFQLFTSYDDDGVAINSYWLSKRYNLKTFDEFKRWFDGSFLFRSVTGVINLEIILDGYVVSRDVMIGSPITDNSGIGVAEWSIVVFGDDGSETIVSTADSLTDVVKRLKVNRSARSIQVKVSTNGINDRFVLTGYNLTYYPYGHFKFPSADKL